MIRLARTADIDWSLREAQHVAASVRFDAIAPKAVHRLQDVHIRGLLTLLGDDERVVHFIDRELGALREYDRRWGTDYVATLRAFASKPRLQILGWLKQPRAHFREQIDGDLVEDGVCGLLIAEKLGVSQPTVTEHMKLLVEIGAVRAKRIKQWTFYKRDEERIRALKAEIVDEV